ncbi:AimR family lysis-lysogeny pheromone receptor [Alkalihalobacillus sp. LMS39]|uniref:AimR family lysis-lysogeny pheromone receptor n=1 Tax=Alkalihalobacillus sp. LMS39 TaxID=2924032 RepID=UPI001FB1BED3|nr:AimR family lysis-lysogeny pheromone receptor [Alkalihalobacillus sp. LMS39]UOE93787.1 AimR family lysis-lysogeny pheromone receptor [Alkalihalobacillus sp. LMS39]
MPNIRDLLSKQLQANPSLHLKISEISGLTKEELDNFTMDKTIFLDFGKILAIVNYVCPEVSSEVIKQYIETLDVNHPTAQQVLEYVFINRFDYSYSFLKRMIRALNEENKYFATVYEQHYKDLGQLFQYDIKEVANSPTLHAFKTIMELYSLFRHDQIPTIIRKKDYVEYTINHFVQDEFIRNYYLLHHYRILMAILLDQNEINECRRMANEILHLKDRVGPNFSINANHVLGISFLFEDYDKGLEYLYETKELYRKRPSNGHDGDIHSSINLHQIMWNREPEDLRPSSKKPSDIHDIAHYYISKNEFVLANEILSNIKESELSQRDSAFHFYYKGILEDDSDHLYKSIMLFKQIGNKFYIQLPINELKKKGMNPILLDTLLIN